MPAICSRCGSSSIREGACLRCGPAVPAGHAEGRWPSPERVTPAPKGHAGGREGTARPAGFWIRALAILVDLLVLGAITTLVGFLGDLAGRKVPAHQIAVVGTVFKVFFEAAYVIVLHGATGQTVGKLMVGVRVVAVDGSQISFGVAFLRWLGNFLSVITLALGYLMAGVREDKRALHDLVAGTRVVYVR